jgi:hypothetical protein
MVSVGIEASDQLLYPRSAVKPIPVPGLDQDAGLLHLDCLGRDLAVRRVDSERLRNQKARCSFRVDTPGLPKKSDVCNKSKTQKQRIALSHRRRKRLMFYNIGRKRTINPLVIQRVLAPPIGTPV